MDGMMRQATDGGQEQHRAVDRPVCTMCLSNYDTRRDTFNWILGGMPCCKQSVHISCLKKWRVNTRTVENTYVTNCHVCRAYVPAIWLFSQVYRSTRRYFKHQALLQRIIVSESNQEGARAALRTLRDLEAPAFIRASIPWIDPIMPLKCALKIEQYNLETMSRECERKEVREVGQEAFQANYIRARASHFRDIPCLSPPPSPVADAPVGDDVETRMPYGDSTASSSTGNMDEMTDSPMDDDDDDDFVISPPPQATELTAATVADPSDLASDVAPTTSAAATEAGSSSAQDDDDDFDFEWIVLDLMTGEWVSTSPAVSGSAPPTAATDNARVDTPQLAAATDNARVDTPQPPTAAATDNARVDTPQPPTAAATDNARVDTPQSPTNVDSPPATGDEDSPTLNGLVPGPDAPTPSTSGAPEAAGDDPPPPPLKRTKRQAATADSDDDDDFVNTPERFNTPLAVRRRLMKGSRRKEEQRRRRQDAAETAASKRRCQIAKAGVTMGRSINRHMHLASTCNPYRLAQARTELEKLKENLRCQERYFEQLKKTKQDRDRLFRSISQEDQDRISAESWRSWYEDTTQVECALQQARDALKSATLDVRFKTREIEFLRDRVEKENAKGVFRPLTNTRLDFQD